MEDNVQAFQRFAEEVRSSAGFINAKFKAIKLSTDEARRCKSQIASDAAENGEALTAIAIRPETPGNIRGLYRMVKRDILKMRQVFSSLNTESIEEGDITQVDTIIQQLENQLNFATTNLEKLKKNRPKTPRPKSVHRKKSAKPIPPKDSPKENEAPEKEEVLKDTFTGTKRHISMPPVVSTKVKKPFTSRNATSNSKKRTWGAFHGHKTLTNDKSEMTLPPAPDTRSLVSSSGSQESDKSQAGKAHFNFTHAPNPQKPTKREKSVLKPMGNTVAKINIHKREGSFHILGHTDSTRQESFTAANKFNREFTNLETLNLNTQVNGTMQSFPAKRVPNNLVENLGPGDLRRPKYFVSRNRTIPDTIHEKRINIKKHTPGYPFGSSFPELPPLSSLKRGIYQGNKLTQ